MLNHFTTSPRGRPIPVGGCPSRIRTSVHGSKVRCPTTRRRGSGSFLESLPGTSRAEKWSGRRDSNPRPSPWQGDALPTEPLPLESPTTGYGGAESQNRTGDTAIFSRVLYQLSYLGPMANQALVTRRRPAGYHGARRPFNDARSLDVALRHRTGHLHRITEGDPGQLLWVDVTGLRCRRHLVEITDHRRRRVEVQLSAGHATHSEPVLEFRPE